MKGAHMIDTIRRFLHRTFFRFPKADRIRYAKAGFNPRVFDPHLLPFELDHKDE